MGWWAVGASAVITVLVWALWVLPVNRSIAAAEPAEIGGPLTTQLAEGATAGIWATGRSALLGTASCSVTGPDGREVPVQSTRDLGWEDTLWWVTARPGFVEIRWFSAAESGEHTVSCVDALGTVEGRYLVADSASGADSVGLGRFGGARYPVSSMLALGAVAGPLLAVLLVPVLGIQTLRVRRAERA